MKKYPINEIHSPLLNTKAYRFGACAVVVGIEPDGWHLSISTSYRYPSWDEIKAARYAFIPHDVTMIMVLPPTKEYINIHENCFHLYQEKGELKHGNTTPGSKDQVD